MDLSPKGMAQVCFYFAISFVNNIFEVLNATYGSISGIALKQDKFSSAIYIADQANNDIQWIDLNSKDSSIKIFASEVDSNGKYLRGLAISNSFIFCASHGGIYEFDLLIGPLSKRLLAGHLSRS